MLNFEDFGFVLTKLKGIMAGVLEIIMEGYLVLKLKMGGKEGMLI